MWIDFTIKRWFLDKFIYVSNSNKIIKFKISSWKCAFKKMFVLLRYFLARRLMRSICLSAQLSSLFVMLWMFRAKCCLIMKNKVQFNIIKSKKWYFWRKSESMGLFSPALIFQEMALWTVYFWGSKGQCSATASSKNDQKVNLGPPKCLETLVIKQFWWIRYPLFWTFF